MSTIGNVGGGAQPMKEWTLLYYLDGKNNLAPMAEHSFSSIDKVGSDDNVNLVAQLGLPKKGVLQGLVKGDKGASFEDIGAADMGSAKNLQQFVEWGMKNYPAKHYALVMWDHGAGFKGSMTDDETRHLITNPDLAKALEDAQKTTGAKLEVLNFNACLMNQAEVGYELRNAASYMVGSEETEAGLRIPIPGVFGTTPQHSIAKDVQQAVKERGGLSGEELAKLFVFESKAQFGASMFTPTQSAIDLAKMETVKDKASQLSGLLVELAEKDPALVDQLRKDMKKTQHFIAADMYIEPYSQYRDLGDFARVIEKDEAFSSDPRVKAAAVELQAAVKDAVVAEWHAPVSGQGGRSLEGSTGLSTYLPPDYGFDKQGHSSIDGVPAGGTHGYENTAFAKDTSWEKMLKLVAKDDDLLGKFPSIQRHMQTFGPVAGYYGYEYAYEVLKGANTLKGFTMWPLMGFPYMLPIPSFLAGAAGAVAGGLRVHKGVQKLVDGVRREDSPSANRWKLGIDGAIDTAVGAGSIVTCGALLAGMGTAAAPAAAAVVALGGGRLLYELASGAWKAHKTSKMSVEEKLDAMADTRPHFGSVEAAAATATPATEATKTEA